MNRRSLLALPIALVAAEAAAAESKQEERVEDRFITPETNQWFDDAMVIEGNQSDDSDMIEIIARLGYVLLKQQLPRKALTRTIARANSRRPDRSFFIRVDIAPAKRALCVIIYRLNEKLKSSDL